ncbi:hypothetical protein DLH72_03415 [Candidatus Gracilibacteria bacterium]|nr:MAG: hypothetical protein DLH72_03415 [Candidatus Gracilibacteria bacterium]
MIIFRNLGKIFTSKYGIIGSIIGFIIMLLPVYFFTWKNRESLIFGYGDEYFYFILGLDTVLAILFGIFLGSTLYKMIYFGNRKASKIGFLGGFLGTLVGGCTSCSLTFASYLGLASFMAFLPYGGLEIKIISVLLLIYVCFSSLKNLEVCNLKLKKA